MKMFRAHSSQRGFTLIELMIAMLIGVFLMAGVIQIFLSAKQAYRLQENLSRLQENGRFAMDFITKDVRMAGFMGCSKALPLPLGTITEQTKINGIANATNNWSSNACSANNECIPTRDVISFQYAKSCGGQLTSASASADTVLHISTSNSCGINVGDQLLIADCTKSDVFSATVVTPTPTSTAPNPYNITHTAFSSAYNTDAELFALQSVSYYIRSGTGGAPSLWRIDNTKGVSGSTNPAELVEGVENMQILYGVDTDQTPDYVANYYVNATTVNSTNVNTTTGTVSAWTRVVSIRINLLTVSIDNNLTDAPQPYTYNGSTTSTLPQIAVIKTDTSQLCPPYTTLPATCQLVDDRRIHRVFSSTIAVRNRLL